MLTDHERRGIVRLEDRRLMPKRIVRTRLETIVLAQAAQANPVLARATAALVVGVKRQAADNAERAKGVVLSPSKRDSAITFTPEMAAELLYAIGVLLAETAA